MTLRKAVATGRISIARRLDSFRRIVTRRPRYVGGQAIQRTRHVFRPLAWHALGVLVVAAIVLVVVAIPRHQAAHLSSAPAISSLDRFTAENEARRTVVQLLGGIAVLAGLFLTLRRLDHAERQLALAQQSHFTERYSRAIEQLGDESMHIRLGGIYALERVSVDSSADYVSVMDVLTAFVRQSVKWNETAAIPLSRTELPQDVQAVMRVLARRPPLMTGTEPPWLDLRQTDLRTLDLDRANLRRVLFVGSHLERAKLWFATLSGSVFFNAHLEDAEFEQSKLVDCVMSHSTCDRARFSHCDLQHTEFSDASLVACDFSGARLVDTIFTKTNLQGANFYGAAFERTVLCGADLTDAKHLNQRQLANAIMDDKTRLPAGLNRSGIASDSMS